MRSPYWVRLRGCGGAKEWSDGQTLKGDDFARGVEVYVGTEQGALILRLNADDYGNISFRLVRMTHVDDAGILRGERRHVAEGLVGKGPVVYEPDLHPLLRAP